MVQNRPNIHIELNPAKSLPVYNLRAKGRQGAARPKLVYNAKGFGLYPENHWDSLKDLK